MMTEQGIYLYQIITIKEVWCYNSPKRTLNILWCEFNTQPVLVISRLELLETLPYLPERVIHFRGLAAIKRNRFNLLTTLNRFQEDVPRNVQPTR